MNGPNAYRGRFAPSPTGPLHAGSLVAALASWLDARAQHGTWLVRIEDLDPPREVAGSAAQIVSDLSRFGLISDEQIVHQSSRTDLYVAAMERLSTIRLVYGCACSRSDVALAQQTMNLQAHVYPGTCLGGTRGKAVRALRIRVPDEVIGFVDRRCGPYGQNLAREVGDFVVRRADGLWAYQLAVVVDDGEQRMTDIVRGADLLDNTPRQVWLQRALGLSTPRYLHVEVVTNAEGEKLSKQTGAARLDTAQPLAELERAWRHLGFTAIGARNIDAFLTRAVELWRERWVSA